MFSIFQACLVDRARMKRVRGPICNNKHSRGLEHVVAEWATTKKILWCDPTWPPKPKVAIRNGKRPTGMAASRNQQQQQAEAATSVAERSRASVLIAPDISPHTTDHFTCLPACQPASIWHCIFHCSVIRTRWYHALSICSWIPTQFLSVLSDPVRKATASSDAPLLVWNEAITEKVFDSLFFFHWNSVFPAKCHQGSQLSPMSPPYRQTYNVRRVARQSTSAKGKNKRWSGNA